MRIITTVALLCIVQISIAQTQGTGSWHIVNAQLNLTKKWQVFAELQTRSQKLTDNFFYYETKAGAAFNINKDFSVLGGFGKYVTFSNTGNYKKPLANDEFRTWQQLIMNNYVNRVKFEHRYRAEQRWLLNGGYRNRFRYRLNTFLPLNSDKLIPKTFYLTAFDEIFLNNKAPHFERNRLFGGMGYIMNKGLTLQAGYLNQYDYNNAGHSNKGFVQVMVLLQFNHSKDDTEKIPQALD